LPGAHRKAPWPNHDDLAVRDKSFAHLPVAGEPFQLSVSFVTPAMRCWSCLMLLRPATARQERLGDLYTPEDELPSIDQLKACMRGATGPRHRAPWSKRLTTKPILDRGSPAPLWAGTARTGPWRS
jgi:hypothetical protein